MRLLAAILSCITLLAGQASAQEPRGTWSFAAADKPIKVIVLGGSVSAYGLGGYSQWLPTVCSRIELKNVAKAKLGAAALKQRFVAQVLQNRKVDPKAAETWLVFLGGLNSIGTPEMTNVDVAATFRLAHEAGLHSMGLTVNPWGSEDNHRWAGADGLEYLEHTQKAVDFVLGRLTPEQAFGKAAAGHTAYAPGELPEIAVDLWDGALRDRDALPRPEKKMLHSAKTSAWVKKRLAGLDAAAREVALAAFVTRAAELPRWFMRPELIGFDAVHPNSAGHKLIAQAVCKQAPAAWGCDCARLEQLAWDKRKRMPVAL